jgi:hypothetical protein
VYGEVDRRLVCARVVGANELVLQCAEEIPISLFGRRSVTGAQKRRAVTDDYSTDRHVLSSNRAVVCASIDNQHRTDMQDTNGDQRKAKKF